MHLIFGFSKFLTFKLHLLVVTTFEALRVTPYKRILFTLII